MTKGSGYVRVWNEEADPSKQLSDENGRFLTEYTKMEAGALKKHIIHIVSNILGMIGAA